MNYIVRLETFSGLVKNVQLPTHEAVSQFVEKYPDTLPAGTAVKMSCDMLGISGTLRGKALV